MHANVARSSPVVPLLARRTFGAPPCRWFDPGRALVLQGSSPTHAYLVRTGAVRVTRLSPDGTEVVLDVLGPGDIVGHLSLFSPGRVEPFEARALTSVHAIVLAHEELRGVVASRPDVAGWALGLALRQLTRSMAVLGELLTGDVTRRVLARLETLAEVHGRPGPEGTVVELPLTQEELARSVGATRESVNRAVAGLERDGRLRREQRRYVLVGRRVPRRPGEGGRVRLRASPAGDPAGNGHRAVPSP